MAESAPLLRVYRETYRGFESLPLRQFPARLWPAECAAREVRRASREETIPAIGEINSERWPSGLRRTLGKRVYRKVPWVRIPLSPPTSLRLQRLCARIWGQREKFARFRGVLARAPSRIRTGDRGFQADLVLRPGLFSAAEFGGSVSPAIRLGEDWRYQRAGLAVG